MTPEAWRSGSATTLRPATDLPGRIRKGGRSPRKMGCAATICFRWDLADQEPKFPSDPSEPVAGGSGAAVMVMVASRVAGVPIPLEAVKVTAKDPVSVGVPDSTPVSVSVRPAGNAPPAVTVGAGCPVTVKA